MSQRRRKPSSDYIMQIIERAMSVGLTATGISHYPDGTIKVHFGNEDSAEKENTRDTWADAF